VNVASGLTIYSNLAALNAERRLGQNTKALEQSFTRLSSGLRINRASDDAAGLAISAALNADARVYSQGIRNLNDAVSMTNIAESAVRELSSIRTRQMELAEQAANGTLSTTQRQALNAEANALVAENNRIIATTDYNGMSLLDSSLGTLEIQAGYGQSGQLNLALLSTLMVDTSYLQADGTFQGQTSFAAGTDPQGVIGQDVNGDGKLDLITVDHDSNTVSVLLGNGDGSFRARQVKTVGIGPQAVAAVDVNSDGILDLITANNTSNDASVLIGNGDGTFKPATTLTLGSAFVAVTYGDFNGDSKVDLAFSNSIPSGYCLLALGAGNGTFACSSSFAAGSRPISITSADVNGDHVLDLITGDVSSSTISVLIGNGNGTFKGRLSFAGGVSMDSVTSVDVDADGKIDIVIGDANGVSVFLGNGDGTFKGRSSFAADGAVISVSVADENADGVLDIVGSNANGDSAHVFLGNGNGTYKAQTSFAVGDAPQSILTADFNGDSILDLVTSNAGTNNVSMLLGGGLYTLPAGTPISLTQSALDLTTRQGALAALDSLDEQLTDITNTLGSIGAAQSRLATSVSNLEQTREQYLAAVSQITDVDFAQETAELVKRQILQKASAAVLAQANQAPELVLILLKPG
jgi:flagellin-like hook-associated protein FlgL